MFLGGLATQAATLRVDDFGNRSFGVYLDGEEFNDNFDTVILDITPDTGFSFGSPDLTPGARLAGEAATYINGFLSSPLYVSYIVLGPVTTDSAVEFTAGILGSTINTENGLGVRDKGLFLANILLPTGTAMANAQLVSAGTVVADLTTPFGVPEPTTLGLAGMGLLGLAGSRRNKMS